MHLHRTHKYYTIYNCRLLASNNIAYLRVYLMGLFFVCLYMYVCMRIKEQT